MTKNDLIVEVANRVEVNKKITTDIVNTTIEVIKDTLAKGEEVKLTGFVNFEIKEVPERKARNIRTGEPIIVPEHKTVKAKLAKAIKDCSK